MNKELENWIRQKLESGVSKDQLKEALKNKGYDPAQVDNVSVQNREQNQTDRSSKVRGNDFRKEDQEVANQNEPHKNKEDREARDEDLGETEGGEKTKSSNFPLSNLKLPNISPPKSSIRKLGKTGKLVFSIAFLAAITLGIINLPVDMRNLQTSLDDFTGNVGNSKDVKSEGKQVFEGTKIVIDEDVAVPARPSLNPGEEVMFKSNTSYGFRISFSSNKKSLRIKPREPAVTGVSTLVYYTARPMVENGSTVKGSIAMN